MKQESNKQFLWIPFLTSLLLAFIGVVLLFVHGLDVRHSVPLWVGILVLTSAHPVLVILPFVFPKVPKDETLTSQQRSILRFVAIPCLLLCVIVCLILEFVPDAISNPSLWSVIVAGLAGVPSFLVHVSYRVLGELKKEQPVSRKVLWVSLGVLLLGTLIFAFIATHLMGSQWALFFLILPIVCFLDNAKGME